MSRQLVGTPAFFTGTASTTMARVVMINPVTKKASYARKVRVTNTGAANALKVYLPNTSDGGPITVPVAAATGPFPYADIEGPVEYLGILAASATTTYEISANIA